MFALKKALLINYQCWGESPFSRISLHSPANGVDPQCVHLTRLSPSNMSKLLFQTHLINWAARITEFQVNVLF